MHHNRKQKGSILVLVVGLSALLLSIAVAVVSSQKALDDAVPMALQEAQNKMTLTSALFFIQERSRIGWGSGPGDFSFGWTDVRDGSPGPRGPADPTTGTITNQFSAGVFPALGAVYRGDLHAWQRPPYAIRQDIAPNPYSLNPADEAVTVWNPITSLPLTKVVDGSAGRSNTRFPPVKPIWTRANAQAKTLGAGARHTQPVSDTWTEFAAGDLRADLVSVGRAWFRIYREDTTDHDGDGDPWYDTVPYGGHGTFIVTVGAGGTRGYRFWNSTTDYLGGRTSLPTGVTAYSAALDAETAQASGLFASEATFRNARQAERIAWYRVQWVANTSTGYDAMEVLDTGRGKAEQNRFHGLINRADTANDNHMLFHQGGAIRFIQRLEQEPPRW